ncbi:MAG: hypothetical protein ACR2ID_01965 [Chthoniobacterales bacterium]
MTTESSAPRVNNLRGDIWFLPAGHLQIEGHARAAASEYETIGHLQSACANDGAIASNERVRQLLNQLERMLRNDPVGGWDSFRRSRSRSTHPGTIYFYSPRLDRMGQAAANDGLARLHLNLRALNALHARGLCTIGDLIVGAREGIRDVHSAGSLTISEIIEALDCLSDSLTADGAIDWLDFARRRHFRILPDVVQERYSGRDFLLHLRKVCEVAVSSTFGDAGSLILRRRIFRNPGTFVALNEIGQQLGLSRQRMSVREREIMEMLRLAIWRGEYQGCPFHINPAFVQPLYELDRRLQVARKDSLTAAGWRDLLIECWGVQPSELGDQSFFLSHLLELDPDMPEELPIAVPAGTTARIVRDAMERIARVAGALGPRTFSLREVWSAVDKQLDGKGPDEITVAEILRILPTVERSSALTRYRIKIEFLRRHVDRCERILLDSGVPMHFAALHSEIRRLVPDAIGELSTHELVSQLSYDKRFSPVGRTGLWSLAEWHQVEVGTIVDVAAKLLSESAIPLSERRLFELIAARRQVRPRSIGRLLSEDRRFRRAGPAGWTLVERFI